VSALLLVLAAAAVAGWAGWRAHAYHADRHDQAWADDTVAWLRSMRQTDFDDHCDQALAVAADDLEQRRLEQTVQRHPAGGAPT
jgi:hypothetical protein